MPLHLLGKKSWNVYNPENIARVQRDEAAAKAQHEREEREQRNSEAATRLEILRGETIPELNSAATQETSSRSLDLQTHTSSRKRRKLKGEDDTDRDIRFAKADAEANITEQRASILFDSNGHIDLVPQRKRSQKDQQASEQNEELVGMRFKDAGGYKSENKPWYHNKTTDLSSELQVSRDVWGNEDPRRREREQQRMSANDPLLAMKKGVKQLRENEKQRKEWIKQRELDLHEVENLARERSKKRRYGSSDEDSIEEFSLSGPLAKGHSHESRKHDRQRRHHHSKHKHRSRSPDREHRHHKHHYRHRDDRL